MNLHYLEFDEGEDAEGHGSFDAMASAAPPQLPALQEEVLRVLAWARREFGDSRPVDEGGEWDYELQGVREVATPLDVTHDAQANRLLLEPGRSGEPRVTLSLTLTGTPQFCRAFRSEFRAGS